jgi:excisionase family DNA binding protein
MISEKIEPLRREIERLKPKRYLTRKEAAKYYRVSMTTIDKAVKNKRLESEMIEGNRRIIVRDEI